MFAFLTKFGRLFKLSEPLNSSSVEMQPDTAAYLRDNQPAEAEYRVAFLAEQAFLLEMAWQLTRFCQEDYYSELYWAKQREALSWHIEARWEEYQQLKSDKNTPTNSTD